MGSSLGQRKQGYRSPRQDSHGRLASDPDYRKEENIDWQSRALAAEATVDRLERYAASIALWCDRENVTDQERLSYIKGHPVTRAAA